MKKMRILSHRGIVEGGSSQNDERAFDLALENGFGLETDLRDRDAHVVISHDPPQHRDNLLSVAQLLNIWRAKGGSESVLALNIKADGLSKSLVNEVKELSPERFFFFDMSLPDSLQYLRAGLPVFARVSEFEPAPQLSQGYRGIWLDCFKSEWFTMDDLKRLLKHFGCVAVVSPELHKRPHLNLWRELKRTGLMDDPRLMVCTDFPLAMKEMVYG